MNKQVLEAINQYLVENGIESSTACGNTIGNKHWFYDRIDVSNKDISLIEIYIWHNYAILRYLTANGVTHQKIDVNHPTSLEEILKIIKSKINHGPNIASDFAISKR